jgi:hypothetical protein
MMEDENGIEINNQMQVGQKGQKGNGRTVRPRYVA